jgi:hypothetical protein
MFKLGEGGDGIELVVSWTASNASVERTYECNGEVCGTGDERRPSKILLVAVESKSIDIDICRRIAPGRIERRTCDGHHSPRPIRFCNVVSIERKQANRETEGQVGCYT